MLESEASRKKIRYEQAQASIAGPFDSYFKSQAIDKSKAVNIWLKRSEFKRNVDKQIAALKRFDEENHVHRLEHAFFAKPYFF
jgi:hypothetical protein